MALSFPLSVADFADRLGVSEVNWSLSDNRELSGLGSGQILEAELAPALYRGEVVLRQRSHDESRELEALINAVKRSMGTFYLGDPRKRFPRYDPAGYLLAANMPSLGVSAEGDFVAQQYQRGGGYVPVASAWLLSRASVATYYDADGWLRSALANQLRFDYDPATRQARGVMLEAAKTNLISRSSEFDDALWGKTGVTVQANPARAPDDTVTGDKLVESATTDAHRVFRFLSTPAAATFTMSIFAKQAGRSRLRLLLVAAGADFAYAHFDLANGTVLASAGSGTAQGVVATIEPSAFGYWRCALRAQPTTDGGITGITALYAVIDNDPASVANGGVYAGDGSSGLYAWGAQIETGGLTSYIPTAASTATRAADLLSLYNAGVNNWTLGFEGGSSAAFNAHSGILTPDPAGFAVPRLRSYRALRVTNGSPYTPQINALPDNKSMSLKGLPPAFTLAAGDYLAFDYGSPARRAFHEVVETVTADLSGVTPVFEVAPFIRPGAVINANVALIKPAMKCKIVPGSVDVRSTGPMTSRIGFSVAQKL